MCLVLFHFRSNFLGHLFFVWFIFLFAASGFVGMSVSFRYVIFTIEVFFVLVFVFAVMGNDVRVLGFVIVVDVDFVGGTVFGHNVVNGFV